METLAYDDWNKLIQGVFITGPALNVLSMELVPPNKEIDWFCPTHWKRQSLLQANSLNINKQKTP